MTAANVMTALAPTHPTQLAALRAYAGAPARPGGAGAPGATPPRARVVLFGSGKGGAGTSTVAALAALAAAASGRRVLLVDPDEHVGPLAHLLGVRARRGLVHLREGHAAESLVVPVSDTLSLLPGGPADGPSAPLSSAERYALLRRVWELYDRYELVVIDGGSRLELVTACVDVHAGVAGGVGGSAARLVAVTGVDPISLAATHALVKATVGGSAIAGAELLVNRADAEAAARAFAVADDAARQFLGRPLRLAGSVVDDSCLELALRGGMTLLDAAAGSPAAVAAHELVERLLRPAGDTELRDVRGSAPSAWRRVMQ